MKEAFKTIKQPYVQVKDCPHDKIQQETEVHICYSAHFSRTWGTLKE